MPRGNDARGDFGQLWERGVGLRQGLKGKSRGRKAEREEAKVSDGAPDNERIIINKGGGADPVNASGTERE